MEWGGPKSGTSRHLRQAELPSRWKDVGDWGRDLGLAEMASRPWTSRHYQNVSFRLCGDDTCLLQSAQSTL